MYVTTQLASIAVVLFPNSEEMKRLLVVQRFIPFPFLFFLFCHCGMQALAHFQRFISHMFRKETTPMQAMFDASKSFIRSFSLYDVSETLIFFFTDVIKSGIGFLVWFAGLTAWILVYQKYRASWGEIGDRISFVIPLGEP